MTVLDEAHQLISRAIEEIDRERDRLIKALKELDGDSAKTGRRRRKAKASASSAGSTPAKRRQRKGGNRADQAVKMIQSSPGISASEIAKRMKIKPNYLYRVLGQLEKEGRVKKDGRKYTAP